MKPPPAHWLGHGILSVTALLVLAYLIWSDQQSHPGGWISLRGIFTPILIAYGVLYLIATTLLVLRLRPGWWIGLLGLHAGGALVAALLVIVGMSAWSAIEHRQDEKHAAEHRARRAALEPLLGLSGWTLREDGPGRARIVAEIDVGSPGDLAFSFSARNLDEQQVLVGRHDDGRRRPVTPGKHQVEAILDPVPRDGPDGGRGSLDIHALQYELHLMLFRAGADDVFVLYEPVPGEQPDDGHSFHRRLPPPSSGP